jgi:hypothetical protein
MNFAVPHSLEELQLIVNALSARPFAEVHELILKIQNHVDGEIANAKIAAETIADKVETAVENAV